MDNAALLKDMIDGHQDRMLHLRRYLPFFKLMDTGFSQFKDGMYDVLDMSYLLMAMLRLLIEYNHFQDRPFDYQVYDALISEIIIRDFELPEAAKDDELKQYILDKMLHDGRPFISQYFDPATHQKKSMRVRLIETELKNQTVLYRISSDGVAFYLDTKEVGEESRLNVSQLLLSKMIKTRNFRGGLDIVDRINLEVEQIKKSAEDIQNLLHRNVREGILMLDAFHQRLLQWFDEEQKLFHENMQLTAQVVQMMEIEHVGEADAQDIYALDTALKNATQKHAELMHLYVQMQKIGDAAILRAKKTKFRPSVQFSDIWQHIMKKDDSQLLAAFVQPLFGPKITKRMEFNRLDDALSYKPDELLTGELLKKEKEKNYEYADEKAEERIAHNFEGMMHILFKELYLHQTVTLDALRTLYQQIFSEAIFKNGDYYAFFTHLSQKAYYDLEALAHSQDTFLEGMINTFLKIHKPEYRYMKFKLVFLSEEDVLSLSQGQMTNIRFERVEQ